MSSKQKKLVRSLDRVIQTSLVVKCLQDKCNWTGCIMDYKVCQKKLIILYQRRIEGGYPVTSNQLKPPKTPRCKPHFNPSGHFLNTVTTFEKNPESAPDIFCVRISYRIKLRVKNEKVFLIIF